MSGETLAAVFGALGRQWHAAAPRAHGGGPRSRDGLLALETTVAASMLSGVLVGLLIADSTLPMDEIDRPVTRA